jgi:hypothetical protein
MVYGGLEILLFFQDGEVPLVVIVGLIEEITKEYKMEPKNKKTRHF